MLDDAISRGRNLPCQDSSLCIRVSQSRTEITAIKSFPQPHNLRRAVDMSTSVRQTHEECLSTASRLDLLGQTIALGSDCDVGALVVSILGSQNVAVERANELLVVLANEQVVVYSLAVGLGIIVAVVVVSTATVCTTVSKRI